MEPQIIKLDADTFQIVETIPEKTIVVPEEQKVTTYDINDIKKDIEMQTGVVADKEQELKVEQERLANLQALLEQGQKAEVKIDIAEELPALEIKK